MGSKKFFFGSKKIFFTVKKNFFTGNGSLKLWWNAHKNFGGIMPGFGTWAIVLEIMVLDHKIFFLFFHQFFFVLKKRCCTFSITYPQCHITPKLTFPPTNNFAPNSTRTTSLWVASPACSHWATALPSEEASIIPWFYQVDTF